MALQVQMQEEDFGMCPSFNSYSTGTTSAAAIRAAGCSVFDFNQSHSPNKAKDQEEDDDDFEFVSLRKPADCDDVFGGGGLIPPAFPIFNSDLLFEEPQVEKPEIDGRDSAIEQPIRIPLEKLLIRDRDYDPQSPSSTSSSSSSSSSSVDELEGVPSETYCVWKPKSIGTPNLACKKSRSTGSSSTKRWGIRDLLRRSHSDGKQSYISFTPSTSSNSTKKVKEIKSETKSTRQLKEKKDYSGGDQKKIFSAHESFYVRNRTLREEGKRKSYLPYKLQAGIGWLLE
ncbi:uncharacterized protein LOC120091294 [Benincasa hispida]|uniref:uncharacterized protein LOC120091294 n=1 Tax=Benincasa hispida TaxID=102211 RepID=UPI001901DA6F|nr:uncharacterized protein LOC120091294 [Benincasa hispida]